MRVAIAGLAAASLLLTLPASAGWREDLGTIRIGVVEDPRGVSQDLSAEQAAWEQALGLPVSLVALRDFGAIIDAQATARIDYAVYSATAYAAAWRLCSCVEPLVAPVWPDGTTGMRAVLIAREGGPASVEDAFGRRIALGPADAILTRLLPLATLTPGGRELVGDEDFFVGPRSDSEGLELFADGEVDALFGWVPDRGDGETRGGTLERLAVAGVEDPRVLWTSQPLRFGAHVVRRDMPEEAKAALRSHLAALALERPDVLDAIGGEGGSLAAVSHADYETALGVVRGIVARQAAR